MSDPRDRVPPPPRIVKSARKLADARLDNPTRPSTTVATKTVTDSSRPDSRIAPRAPIPRPATDPRLDDPTRLVAAKTATRVNDARPDNRLGAKVPTLKSAIADARGADARPRDQDSNARPVSRNPSRPDAARNVAIHEPLRQTDVAARGPKKVTFNIGDFPLPVERRLVARNRVGQNSGRGLGSSGAQERREELPSQSASFFPERSSQPGATRKSSANVPRRGLGRQSTNNAFNQNHATKSQPMSLHIHTESVSGKFARKFEGVGGRTPSRVPRMSSANKGISQDHLVDSSSEHSSGSANYVDVGLKLSKLSRGESSGNSVEIVKETGVQVKAARKLQIGRKSTQAPPEIRRSVTPIDSQSSESSDNDESAIPAPAREDSEELEYVHIVIDSPNITREQTEPSSESDVAERDEAPAEIPSDTLIEALEKHFTHDHPARKITPAFLSSYETSAKDFSSDATQIAEDRYPERQVTRTTMTHWKCPLCELHGVFPTQQILSAHLRWDHVGVRFWWDMDDYTLWVQLPLTRHVHYQLHCLPVGMFHSTMAASQNTLSTCDDYLFDKDCFDRNHRLLIQFHNDEYTPETTQPPSRNTSVASQPFPDANKLDIKPTPIFRTGSLALSTTRSSSVTSRTLSRASSTHASGRPTPPPRSDPLGPAAQYPYLLESDGVYSCRVGGPRLYDLLNTLPLDKFGVLAWVILEREEEIFEPDNVRDEDKVMQALWFRWIFLNRNKFVANFFEGTKTFIDDNWQMIARAAGAAALRTWLLVLSINNFLMTSGAVELLRHYRKLTGKKHWYDDTNATQNEVAPV